MAFSFPSYTYTLPASGQRATDSEHEAVDILAVALEARQSLSRLCARLDCTADQVEGRVDALIREVEHARMVREALWSFLEREP